MKMAEMDVEVSIEVGLDAVRDWLVCCHYNKKDADVFLRHGYGSINSIRSEMTEHDYNRIQSSIDPGAGKYKILSRWRRVERLQDIPKDKISQELLVRVTKYLKLQDTSKSYKILVSLKSCIYIYIQDISRITRITQELLVHTTEEIVHVARALLFQQVFRKARQNHIYIYITEM